MRSLVSRWGPVILYMAAIFVVSGLSNVSALPGPDSDKVGHFFAYAVLGALVLRALAGNTWRGVTRRTAVAAWSIAVAYGVTDEIHQYFVPGRAASVADWTADALGAAVAVALALAAAGARRVRGREV